MAPRPTALVLAAIVASILAVLAPLPALAHDEAATTIQGHVEEDSVIHTPAMERRLDQRTSAATAADAEAAAAGVVGSADQVGRWGPVVDWPVVGVHVALLENGKVLAYDSVGDHATETYPVHDFTRATVWDPATGTQTPVNVNTGFNIFCSGLAHLMDGSLFVAGGNKNAQLEGIVQTHIFDSNTNTWSLGPNMAAGRWYPSVTPLNNGEMLITEGGPDMPEVRKTDGSLRALRHGLARPAAVPVDRRSARRPRLLLRSRPDDAKPRPRRRRLVADLRPTRLPEPRLRQPCVV